MKIKNHFLEDLPDPIDLDEIEMVAVSRHKYSDVRLCLKGFWNVPIAEIKLHPNKLAKEAQIVYKSATDLGEEIARRWNGQVKELKTVEDYNNEIQRLRAERVQLHIRNKEQKEFAKQQRLDWQKKIPMARAAKGMNQKQFADKLGVSQQAVSKWEKGEKTCSVENQKKIQNLLGI